MQDAIRRRITIALACAALALMTGPRATLAQSGSAGGSIGNDEKSLSGPRSVEPERPAHRSKPQAAEPRRSSRRNDGGGGGGGNFDGAWIAYSHGNTCGSATQAFVVSSGRISGDGLSGVVSPSGATSSLGQYGDLTVTSSGRFSGRSGSGTFRRSDGCVGTWTVSKQ